MPSEASGDDMVAFRLAARDRAAIQRLVDAGEFRNRSDFFRYAVKALLAEYDEDKTRAKLDLSIEGVELPEHPPSRKARRPPKGVNL